MALGVGLPYIAEGAITRGQALMMGTAYPQLKPTTGANVKIIGYALDAAADGQEAAYHPVADGSAKCKAVASATISRGDDVGSSSTTGRLATITANALRQYGAGVALEAAITGQLFDIMPAYFQTAVVTTV